MTKKSIGLHTCDECHREIKNFRKFKGQFLCHKCFRRKNTMIYNGGKDRMSLEKAVGKIYKISGYAQKHKCIDGSITVSLKAILSLPSILIGHKIKIVVVE